MYKFSEEAKAAMKAHIRELWEASYGSRLSPVQKELQRRGLLKLEAEISEREWKMRRQARRKR